MDMLQEIAYWNPDFKYGRGALCRWRNDWIVEATQSSQGVIPEVQDGEYWKPYAKIGGG